MQKSINQTLGNVTILSHKNHVTRKLFRVVKLKKSSATSSSSKAGFQSCRYWLSWDVLLLSLQVHHNRWHR